MTISCEILINKSLSGKYRPGQSVTGIVRYAIDEPIEVNEIIISFTGRGNCSWSETESRGDEKKTYYYTGTEEYVSCFLKILDRPDGNTTILPAGTYDQKFDFVLPANTPSSFKDHISSIVYRIKVKFKRSGLFKSNKKFFAEIPVYSNLDTDENGRPVVFGLKKALVKPLSAKNHVVNLRAEIDKCLILPGEETKLSYVVTNDTNVEINSVKAEIICMTLYTANCGKQKLHTSTVPECVVHTPSVPAEAIANMTNVIKTLPEMYSIQNSKIINREYKVKVTVRLKVPYRNSSVEVPILIGIRANDETIETSDEPPSYWEVMCKEQ